MDPVISVSERLDALPAVAGLLRSLGLSKNNEVLALAARLVASGAGGENAEKTRRLAIIRLGSWFGRALGQPELDAEQAFLIGRAAFVEIDAARRWPGALMADSPPADFTHALAAHAPHRCPVVPTIPMVGQPLDAPSLLSPLAWLIRGLMAGGARTA